MASTYVTQDFLDGLRQLEAGMRGEIPDNQSQRLYEESREILQRFYEMHAPQIQLVPAGENEGIIEMYAKGLHPTLHPTQPYDLRDKTRFRIRKPLRKKTIPSVPSTPASTPASIPSTIPADTSETIPATPSTTPTDQPAEPVNPYARFLSKIEMQHELYMWIQIWEMQRQDEIKKQDPPMLDM
jgi:hypothetical protein